jgi:hypothetical protein
VIFTGTGRKPRDLVKKLLVPQKNTLSWFRKVFVHPPKPLSYPPTKGRQETVLLASLNYVEFAIQKSPVDGPFSTQLHIIIIST